MPLSLTTRRRQQTSSSNKWSSSQQHLSQHQQDLSSVNTTQHSLRHHNHLLQQPVRKQRSFIEPSHFHNSRLSSSYTGRNYLSRGISVERSHDIQRTYAKQVFKKHNSNNSHTDNGKSERNYLKPGDLIKKNITACGQSGELLRNSRRLQAWSSTSSILKTLDKELSQLNDVVGKCKDVKSDVGNGEHVEVAKITKTKTDSVISTSSHGSQVSKKSIKPEVNKVNLSIVLSHALNTSKEEYDCVLSDQDEDSDGISTDSGKIINSSSNYKNNKKPEIVTKPSSTSSNPVPAQQRRALYHNSRLSSNLALTTTNPNNAPTTNAGIQNPQNFNVSPSLTVQKRPPLVRAMSAPVRSFDESTKGSFFANKRKSRRRKLNTRQISCIDKAGDDSPLATKDLNFDSKPGNNKKVLTRSKSVAPDVITLVSLISSEGSDSEKEDSSTATPTNSDSSSPTRRAPSLRKTGKSVSFQENYPPTFQFASKEYSHMLRRGSIAPLAQRIKSNRPPTAPPGSIFNTSNKLNTEMNDVKENHQEKENQIENIHNTSTSSTTTPTSQINNINNALEEEYEFPEYVRSLKERECWKLYMKMSTKGVSITYDTILRGMLTPTEFRQLQKQREIEEAKVLKESEESALNEEKPKGPTTAIERLSESLLKK